MMKNQDNGIIVKNLDIGYGTKVIQSKLNFTIKKEEIFVIMGGSGCGKSTLLRTMIGLNPPLAGKVLYDGKDFWALEEDVKNTLLINIGVLFQQGALWTSRTLVENIMMPLEIHFSKKYSKKDMHEIASMKLALVGLAGFENYFPSEISGGMRKRAGLARALALDPEIVYFDEPSAGLDPLSAARLDDLILELRDSLGVTVVIVTHELASIFAIASNSVFLDAETKTMLALGNPHELLKHGPQQVCTFLCRGAKGN